MNLMVGMIQVSAKTKIHSKKKKWLILSLVIMLSVQKYMLGAPVNLELAA